jgi:hypothetical protein
MSATPSTGSAPLRPLSPLCARLRSKKYFLLGRAPMTDEDILDASQHCWCARTSQLLGPDGEPAHPGDCRAGRSCYEPLGRVSVPPA